MIRWVTTVLSLALASPDIQDGQGRAITATAVIGAVTVWRSFRPIRASGTLATTLCVLTEAAVTALVIAATGYWGSAFVFSALTAVAVAGFARGFGFGLRVAALVAVSITLSWALVSDLDEDQVRTTIQLSAEVVLVGLVTGFARRISGEAEQRQTLALDRLGRLSDANTLLYQLHQVTQTLPSSFDLDEVLDGTAAQVEDLFRFGSMALLLRDDTDDRWRTVRRHKARPPALVNDAELPPPLRRCLEERRVVTVPNLLVGGGPGLSESASSGAYAPLVARGAAIGILVLEDDEPHGFDARDVELLTGFVETAALAIDNARWFGRLRTVGADEERTRIARDLHDRIGQSLAYLAFELDRLVRLTKDEPEIQDPLDQLRDDVRGVIREVRDTLYDLRTDVTETQSLPVILQGYLDRVRDRSGLATTLRTEETGRLPILQEREMWRIAQEAVTNVERHAQATQVTVTWRCDGTHATLEVADDGVGFAVGKAGRLDSYGLMGMRERADSIGAQLTLASEPSRGTRVRCVV